MNIYATGMNPVDANTLRRKPRVKLFQAFVEMMKYFEDQNHQVIWQRTKVGDEIPPNTDVVIVSSMLPRSMNCPYALGVMWTMSECIKRDIPMVLYLTDWAFYAAANEFKSIARAGGDYFFKTIGGKPQYAEDEWHIRKHSDQLLELCSQYGRAKSKFWKHVQILVPRYTNWGDIRFVQDYLPGGNRPIREFDPTPIFLDYLDDDNHRPYDKSMWNRERQWVLPSLLKSDIWTANLGIQWPIQRYGPKKEQVLDTERDVQYAYMRSVGALCPPYVHEGSGWWRSRWIHSAKAGSILLCGITDAHYAGAAYKLSGPQVETMDGDTLMLTAKAQKERMQSLLQTSHDLMDDQLWKAIKGAGA